MKPIFDRHAGLAQRIAKVRLHADQSWQLGAGDAGPQNARASDIGEAPNPLNGEAKTLMSPGDGGQRGRQVLDIRARKVAQEMERQVDPFEGIDPNDVAKRLERANRPGQRRADGIGNLDREKDTPALGLIRWHDRRP
jgi:hypothetical protein